MIKLEEDRHLTIQLLSYDRSNESTEGYYFLEMSTLQATTLLPRSTRITSSELVAYTDENKYLDKKFKTIGDFNEFFVKYPEYYIHNCELQLENGTIISSHDDGEVSIKFPIGAVDQDFVDNIFVRYNLDKSLIEELKGKPGHFFSIDGNSKVIDMFETFDEYLKKHESLK